VREAGAAVRLITDGDIAGIIFTASPDETGVDIYLGTGAAPEGVLAAAALRCIGGQMQGRLILDTPERRRRAEEMGITQHDRKYGLTDLAGGDVIVAATGVTDGSLLRGVRFRQDRIQTETVVYRSEAGTIRRILGEHRRDFGRS
jgi:fructose-1,6-bisphosphatase II / sedoheptulose-1,7-bisphosphatase